MNTFGNKASLIITAPVAAGMVKATKAAMDYEDQLAALGTMPGVTADSLKDLSNGLFTVSDATNTALSSLSAAEYQALSSGVAVNQATGYMKEREGCEGGLCRLDSGGGRQHVGLKRVEIGRFRGDGRV